MEPLILITLLALVLLFRRNITLTFLYQLLFHPDTIEDEGTTALYAKPITELTDAELLTVASNILDLSEDHIFEHVRKATGTVTEYDRCFCVNGDFRLPPYMRQWMRQHLDTLRLTL